MTISDFRIHMFELEGRAGGFTDALKMNVFANDLANMIKKRHIHNSTYAVTQQCISRILKHKLSLFDGIQTKKKQHNTNTI